MIKFILERWDANKDFLEKKLRELQDIRNEYMNALEGITYKDLVELIAVYIIGGQLIDPNAITEIDDGDYQGTLLYVIPMNTYQPACHEYFMTYVGHGSCYCCDTLEAIRFNDYDEEQQIKDFMTLCRDICSNIIVPYNKGWRANDNYEEVEFND